MSAQRRPSIEVALAARAEAGEGAVWCDRRQVVWWVDIQGKTVNAFHPAAGENRAWPVGETPGCLALTDGEELILGTKSGLAVFCPATGEVRRLAALEPDLPDNRANDGAVSRDGRFFVGSTAVRPEDRATPGGNLHRLDPDGRIFRVLGGLHVANGIAFSPDNRTMWLSDSWPKVQTVWAFDYDADDGVVANRRVFFDARQTAGRPDGACADANGCYWTAGVGGGEVLRLTPDGRVDLRVKTPALRPSKPCFGGPRLDELFVTTLGAGADPDSSSDGALLVIRCGCVGLPEPRLARWGKFDSAKAQLIE